MISVRLGSPIIKLSCCLVLMGSHQISYAQSDVPEARKRNVLLEEVVVTAQKREQNNQDVPVAISAFSGDQLAALGVESTKDLGTVTPGLQFSETAGFTLVYLRGVGTDSFLPYADPSVATYVDGLYIPAQQGLINSLGGVERVEVLKGPQGTLFGRNSTGGALVVTTKAPGEELFAQWQLERGNFGSKKAQAFATLPVTDTLAFAISGVYSYSEPYYTLVTDDLGPGEVSPENDLQPEESKGVRLRARWTPTDNLELNLGGYEVRQSGTGSTVGALKNPSLLATAFGITAEQGDYRLHRNENTELRVESSTVFGDIRWALPWFDVKLLGGYQDITTLDAYYDFDNSAKDLVSFGTNNAYSNITTAELQITSNENSWRADRFEWVGGVYYLESDAGYDPIFLDAGGAIPVPGALEGLGLSSELVNQVTDAASAITGFIPGVNTEAGIGIRANIHGVLDTESYSVYAQGEYNFTESLGLTVGGRYQEESRFLSKQFVTLPNENGSETTALQYHEPEVVQTNFSPKVSVNFRPGDDKLFYMLATKGYKSGTYNGINIYTAPTYVNPEEVTSFELGMKAEFFDRNLKLNAAVFHNDVEEMQVTFVSLTNGGAITFENAGSARIKGAEFDFVYVVFPEWNPDFVINGGASYLDAVFTDYKEGSGFDETTGLFFSKSGDFTGNRVPRSPEWSGNLGLNQNFYSRLGIVEIGIDYYYNGGFFYSAQNTDIAKQDAYALVGARVAYTYAPWNLKLTVYGENLADESYSYSQFTADFGTNYTLAPPRQYGLRINWEY